MHDAYRLGRLVQLLPPSLALRVGRRSVQLVDHLATAVPDEDEHVREVHLAQRPVEEQQEDEDAREQEADRGELGEHESLVRMPAEHEKRRERVHEGRAEHAEGVGGQRRLAQPLRESERIRRVPELRHQEADREDDAREGDHSGRDRAQELLAAEFSIAATDSIGWPRSVRDRTSARSIARST